MSFLLLSWVSSRLEPKGKQRDPGAGQRCKPEKVSLFCFNYSLPLSISAFPGFYFSRSPCKPPHAFSHLTSPQCPQCTKDRRRTLSRTFDSQNLTPRTNRSRTTRAMFAPAVGSTTAIWNRQHTSLCGTLVQRTDWNKGYLIEMAYLSPLYLGAGFVFLDDRFIIWHLLGFRR